MRLEPGDVAVPFTAQAIDGTAVSLNQFAGRPVLLMFFRYASCPMCNLHLRDFAKEYDGLRERGLAVLAFFHSPAHAIQAHAGGRRYPFPLVSDPDFCVYRKYGVETSWPRLLLSALSPRFYVSFVRSLFHGFWGGMAWHIAKMPADFLVGPDGRLVAANYGRDIGDHLPVARLHTLLDGL
jgi:thioredoxin-dependent peroxiredoxin